MANFLMHNEITNSKNINDWSLYFQYGTYNYDDNTSEDGYRFIWKRPNGNLQPGRAQARIPSKTDIFELLALASKAGWLIE